MKNVKSWKTFNEDIDFVDLDLIDPKFSSIEDFMNRIGVKITKSTGEYKPGIPEEPNVNIRKSDKSTIYGFKIESDYINFINYVSEFKKKQMSDFNKNIEYRTSYSEGARYPYHVIINKPTGYIPGFAHPDIPKWAKK